MTRHAVHEAARRAGLDESAISEVMGHGGVDRILCQPLPNVGHRYADGRLRRVLLSERGTLSEEVWLAVIYRLSGAPLMPLGRSNPLALLVPVGPDDKLVGRYLGMHRAWTTATPVVLPGHNHRRGRPRLARLLRRHLRHACIPEALVEQAMLEPTPIARGSIAAQRARVPSHLQAMPRTHLTIHWRRPSAGPFALGAGVGYGFGILAAL